MSADRGFEWRTKASIFGFPLICIAFGRDPDGRIRIAKGFLAVGQFAYGGIVIAQFGAGILTLSQFAVGLARLRSIGPGASSGIGAGCEWSNGHRTGRMGTLRIVSGRLGQIHVVPEQDRYGSGIHVLYRKDDASAGRRHQFGEVIRGGYEWGSKWLMSIFK